MIVSHLTMCYQNLSQPLNNFSLFVPKIVLQLEQYLEPHHYSFYFGLQTIVIDELSQIVQKFHQIIIK
ncbi:hypothetical protein pb186bvf_005089 [Paramecium bursaria]